MKINSKYIAAVAFAGLTLLAATSCSEPKFKVDGLVSDAQNESVILEKADFYGRWIVVDSTRVGKDGKFTISHQRPASPEIYRLRMAGQFLYFPVDSTETVSIRTSAGAFGSDFELSGSDNARLMGEFEKSLQKLDMSDTTAVKNFKREVYQTYLMNAKGSILSYYVLTKTVGDKALYDAVDNTDARYFAAVATAYDQYNPDDPHGKMVKDAAVEAMRERNSRQGRKHVIEAGELKVLDLNLPDENGREVALSDITEQGVRTIVVFGMMNEPESPALNHQLAELKDVYGPSLNIYQISFDEDLYAWREAAANLPWTTVSDPGGVTSDALVKYNVGALPVFFIYDSMGDLADRAVTFSDLRTKLSKVR